MKHGSDRTIAAFPPMWAPALLAVMMLFSSCAESRNREDLSRRLIELEGAADDEARVRELKQEIRRSEKQVEDTLSELNHQGTYWRLLGLKYMDMGMWGKALEAFDRAVDIFPEHAPLLYYRGLCAAQMALVMDLEEPRLAYLKRAEAGYRRAVSVDPHYSSPYYALANLLIFELDRPLEAASPLDSYLGIERSHTGARFLRARVFLEEGLPAEALRLYEEIQRLSSDEKEKKRAKELWERTAGGSSYAP